MGNILYIHRYKGRKDFNEEVKENHHRKLLVSKITIITSDSKNG